MRPPDTWSAVTTSRASTEGWRKVAGETSVPSLSVVVIGGERVERRPGVERAVAGHAVERHVVIGAEQRLEAGSLGGGRQRPPLVPGDALLALDHQAHAHVSDNTCMREQIDVRRVRGDDPVARELVAAMEAWVSENFGPATPDRTSTVTAAEMVPPDGAFVVLYEDGEAVAGGGIRRLEDGVAEIKRMFVLPPARGRGHGRRVLAALEEAAADLGYRRVRLDTAQSMTTAIALYRGAGYRDIPDYNGNSYASYWGEKVLS